MSTPRMGYCPKCKGSCEIHFAASIKREDGKIIRPKNGKKVMVIPNCPVCNKPK